MPRNRGAELVRVQLCKEGGNPRFVTHETNRVGLEYVRLRRDDGSSACTESRTGAEGPMHVEPLDEDGASRLV